MLTKTLATRFPTLTQTILTLRLAMWLTLTYPTFLIALYLTFQVSWLPYWTPILTQVVVQLTIRTLVWRNNPHAGRIQSFQRWCLFRLRLPALLAVIKGDTKPAYLIAAAPGSKRTTSSIANRIRPVVITPRLGYITRITPRSVTCTVKPAKGQTLEDLDKLCPNLAADNNHIHSVEVDYRRTTTTKGYLTIYFGDPLANTIPNATIALTPKPSLQLVPNHPPTKPPIQDQPRRTA